MRGFLDAPGVLFDDEDENAIQALEPSDFPVTLYDRPGLAFSNLLLRGDVDAATRAIFSPQSLTPAEMQTFSKEILKGRGKDNKLLKTITDVATNPFVIMGIIMSIKYPVQGGTGRMFKIWSGLDKSMKAPGWLASRFHSGLENLRNLPGLFRSFAAWARETGNVVFEEGEALNKVWNLLGRRPTEKELLMISAYRQGFHLPEVKGIMTHGTTNTIQKIYGLKKGQAIWPGLKKQMGSDLIRTAKGLGKWGDNIWFKRIVADPKRFKEFQNAMRAKGHFVPGEYVKQWFPISGRYSRLEGLAVYSDMRTQKGYHQGMEMLKEFTAGSLKKVQGGTIGQIAQLRKMEGYGMPPIVDRILGSIAKDTARMETFVKEAWRNVRGTINPKIRSEEFATLMMEKMKAAGISARVRLGGGKIANRAMFQAGGQLNSVAGNPAEFAAKAREIAAVITEPMQYDMHPIRAYQRYLTSMASSYTWHIQKAISPVPLVTVQKAYTGFRPLVEELSAGAVKWQHSYIKDQLIPLMRGFKPWNAYGRAVTMGNYKSSALTWLNTHPAAKKLIPPQSKEWLSRYFGDFSSLSSESLGAKISEYFYVSTLGMNISPAAKNLLQNYITMIHIPGISKAGMTAGMGELLKNTAKYKSYLASGMKGDAAFHKAYPDFIAAVGKAPGMTRPIASGAMAKGQLTAAVPAAMKTGWAKAKDVSLAGFSATEKFNRLFGFYVGKHSHHIAGASWADAEIFGSMVNQAAHFPGGPLGMPTALLGRWSPARQFMHFPMRYAGFLRASMDWGTGPSRFTPMARAIGASAGAYTGVKNLLGADISQGLMVGALPLPQYEGAPLFPWPLVPPFFSVAAAGAQSLATGEATQAKRAVALLAPAGIAVRRLYKTLGPKYADYENRTEDGRIPVYNENRSLIGAFTPWQLTMRSIGIAPSSQQAEYDAAKWLITQRDKIRAYRRDYLEALSENDVRKAGQVNAEFQKAYPELGALQLKKSDITAVHNRREISRLNRILKGFPKAYQPLFSHMISQSGLAEITQNLERNPTAIDSYSSLPAR